MTPSYPHLAQPIDIGSVTSKNRIMKNGTGFFWDDPSTGGFMNDQYLDYFEALAKGGAGLISSATGPLIRDVKAPMPGFKVVSDEYIPGWRKWAGVVQKHGALAFHQLFHLGPMTPLFVTAPPGISASSIPREQSPRPGFSVPREATVAEIEDVIDMFAEAAERMKRAGLDGTEVNGACNHFLNNFMSRAWNKREDEYGAQTLESRMRPFVSVIKEIKRRNGADWPIIALFNAVEVDLADGITIEESKLFAQELVKAGADALEVRAEYYTWVDDVDHRQSLHFPDVYFYPGHEGPVNPYVDAKGKGAGANIPMAAEIKKVVDVPVITVGRLDQNIGEKAIADGKIDIISLNRRLFADPELPRKVFEGRTEDINVCNSCMTCFDACEHFQPVKCRVNASLGKEREYAITPAPVRKKIMVIGGGPAGMEAARVAALRGHEVHLYEKQPKLGGSLPVAAVVKGKREDLLGTASYLTTQVKKAGVEVHAGITASARTAEQLKPDAIVVATGGLHDVPDIPGIGGRNVLTAEKLQSTVKTMLRFTDAGVVRALSGLPVAKNLVIGKDVVIMGGRLHGCQTAEFLLEQGKRITIVDTASEDEIGEGLLEVFMKPYLLYWLKDHGVRFVTEVEYESVVHDGLVVRHKDGRKELLAADTVVTALPLKPNTAIQKALAGKAPEVYTIGDAGDPKLIVDAIAAGAKVAREI
ncbi:FAD-dependent oxidoreductase [Actinotalea sp. M2MS4P-6]|uniref:oxidoreductase n=1 Tax=Actinotalea sp. M2MS4P-6 TaxID=2983762 RepID=UPI0021E4CAF4|nr:FAD-dependent oxidoreductase [Actinotalea sp. M2MS4P-6]MCV2394295.1 FAD-dependent oxidoreductase [Actinotalea sp. M2MS4P-6]